MNLRLKTLAGFILAGVLISACVLPESNDPFERLPEEELQTIHGDLFPFAVSVSTRATHRLERDEKLVGYLTSDLVRLEDFEGRPVELDGVWRTEKMREIFWVEAVRLQGIKEEESTVARFSAKNFTFLYPKDWEFSESDEKLSFVDKNDSNRRVFLTMAIEAFSPEAVKVDPNFVLSGIAGTKEIETKENGREQETIRLFSNDGTQQYVFKAEYAPDDFDRKRAMLDLLESFVEGEEQVQLTIEGEKIKQAEAEAARIAAKAEQEALEAKARLVDEVVDGDSDSLIDRLLSREEGDSDEVSNEASSATESPDESETAEPDNEVDAAKQALEAAVAEEAAYDYTNLIDARAYSYTSEYLGLRVNTPYGFWYQHFGTGANGWFEFGVADSEINGRSTIDFWLRGTNDAPPAETTATAEAGQLIIRKPWGGKTLEIAGPEAFKDAMWSVIEGVEEL